MIRRCLAAGAVAGLLLTLALPPFGWWPLGMVGAGVLAVVLDDRKPRHRALVGLGTGLGLLVPGFWWMSEFTEPGYVLASLLISAMVVVACALVPGRGVFAMVGLPAALVVLEAARGAWPFGGVPVATVAQTQLGGPLAQVARLGGGLLVTGLVGIVGVAAGGALRGRRRVPVALVVVVLAVVVASIAVPDRADVGDLRVAIVQGGGERGLRATDESAANVFEAHRTTSERVPPEIELVLWPEDVVDVPTAIESTDEGRVLAELADELDTTLVAGIVEDAPGERFANYAQAWGPDGEIGDRYVKNQRVPFGEYIPFRSVVEDIADVSDVPRDATVGDGPGLLDTAAGRLGVVISYEVFFPRRARDAMRAGAQVLLVPTNAASFTTTQMPALELGAARLRAIETGRWVLQAAPTGFSGVIDPDGNVQRHTALGERRVLVTDVDLLDGQTPYTRLGDGPFVVLAVLALVGAMVLELRTRPLR